MVRVARWLAFAMIPAAGAVAEPAAPPFLDRTGAAEFRAYLDAPDHRAFAVAPGGAWGWASAAASPADARAAALATCGNQSAYRCVALAVDGQTVFDDGAWARAWRSAASPGAPLAPDGQSWLGRRLPDLAFVDATGKRSRIGALRGKTVIVHLWGAWCPPCRHELPELQRLHAALRDDARFAFVILQVREPIAQSRRWAADKGIDLPLADSGVDEEHPALRLANGRVIDDRAVAGVFPATWVLDAGGRVVLEHRGPLAGWPAYAPVLRDIAASAPR